MPILPKRSAVPRFVVVNGRLNLAISFGDVKIRQLISIESKQTRAGKA
jgi:hypothetical protein